MNKYIIWTSPNSGEYVKADKVEEFDGRILFIRTTGVVDAVVKDFSKTNVIDYHEVK